jgi:hypothetical protein
VVAAVAVAVVVAVAEAVADVADLALRKVGASSATDDTDGISLEKLTESPSLPSSPPPLSKSASGCAANRFRFGFRLPTPLPSPPTVGFACPNPRLTLAGCFALALD